MKPSLLHKIIYTILGFALAFIFFPHGVKDANHEALIAGASTTAQDQAQTKAAPELASNIQAPDLSAKSALAFDLDSGTVLYSKNLDEKLPIASLTKLITALVVVNHAKLTDIVTVTKDDETPIGSTIGVVTGEQLTIEDLLKALLIPSANDAALTLGNYVGPNGTFIDMMNDEAKILGLANTKFANPVGWDSDDNYSNALDLVKVVQEVMKHPELLTIARTKQIVIASTDNKYYHSLTTTNQLMLNDSYVVGLKTGFTSEALGNMIILSDENDRMVTTIVLGSQNREDDSQKLLDWLYQAYKW